MKRFETTKEEALKRDGLKCVKLEGKPPLRVTTAMPDTRLDFTAWSTFIRLRK